MHILRKMHSPIKKENLYSKCYKTIEVFNKYIWISDLTKKPSRMRRLLFYEKVLVDFVNIIKFLFIDLYLILIPLIVINSYQEIIGIFEIALIIHF